MARTRLPGPARLLDLTRLVSRLSRGPLTGVDRVELAYLEALLAEPGAAFALVRTGAGFLLLDRSGMAAVGALARGEAPLGAVDLLGRLTRRSTPLRARAEATVRQRAIARCLAPLLRRMLRQHLPPGASYLSVGHANLTDRVMRAVRCIAGARIAVLVHDTIPLDHPELTRAGTPQAFARKLQVVARHADLVIHSSGDARSRTERHLSRFGRVPGAVVAALGVPLAPPDAAALPRGVDLSPPYFVTIGTIEPRKNHALLLDVWQALCAGGGPLPGLFIIGQRGWADPVVLRRLDAGVPGVVELPGLGDGAVAALLSGAEALLFPTLAEGFGLPALEAAGRGVPVICTPLPVFHDILGDYPVYLASTDRYSWTGTIERATLAALSGHGSRRPAVQPPDWAEHFKKVFTIL